MAMANKYYVYGCSELLQNLEELIDGAAQFEEDGKSVEEWLIHEGLENINDIRRQISWGLAINMIIARRVKELLRIREESMRDWPF